MNYETITVEIPKKLLKSVRSLRIRIACRPALIQHFPRRSRCWNSQHECVICPVVSRLGCAA